MQYSRYGWRSIRFLRLTFTWVTTLGDSPNDIYGPMLLGAKESRRRHLDVHKSGIWSWANVQVKDQWIRVNPNRIWVHKQFIHLRNSGRFYYTLLRVIQAILWQNRRIFIFGQSVRTAEDNWLFRAKIWRYQQLRQQR